MRGKGSIEKVGAAEEEEEKVKEMEERERCGQKEGKMRRTREVTTSN